eukprot:7004851-Prymnesium_polylepis.1
MGNGQYAGNVLRKCIDTTGQQEESSAVLKPHGQRAVLRSPGNANCTRFSHFLRSPNANVEGFSLLAFPSEIESFLNLWVASLFLVER